MKSSPRRSMVPVLMLMMAVRRTDALADPRRRGCSCWTSAIRLAACRLHDAMFGHCISSSPVRATTSSTFECTTGFRSRYPRFGRGSQFVVAIHIAGGVLTIGCQDSLNKTA